MLQGMLLILYAFLHLISLTLLPVFSDEAIYIRWAQLAWNEPVKYLFLSMLDGKTPLHIWLMVPFLNTVRDPLFAGRLFSVIVGMLSVIGMGKLMSALGGKVADVRLTQLLVMLLPFWFFHHRMALADALLTSFFIWGLYSGLMAFTRKSMKWTMCFALMIGASLWTKVSALFFVPVFVLIPALSYVVHHSRIQWFLVREYIKSNTCLLAIGGSVGIFLFLLLKFSPLFPFLFVRSADYTFTIQDLARGEWRFVVFTAVPRLVWWLAWYVSPFVLVLSFFSGKKGILLGLMALVYALPLVVGGRVTYSRYFLPMAVPLTLMAVMGYRALYARGKQALALGSVIGACAWSLAFIVPSYVSPAHIPFAQEDVVQYLTEWSSGFGISQVRDFLMKEKQKHPIRVGTEGYFGTLPEGLQIYFDRPEDAKNIVIDGVGQPIQSIPQILSESAKTQETYLVVNSHRFLLDDRSKYERISAFERPRNGPRLLLLRILPEKR